MVHIEKTNEFFRVLYEVKGRFAVHRITPEEGKYKLCKVRKVQLGRAGVPFLVTHNARTIRYPNPDIKVNDVVKVDLATGKITEHVKFATGNICMITGGNNLGRVGVIEYTEHHPGSFDIIHVRDMRGHAFSTRLANVFMIGRGVEALVSLPKRKGVRLTIMEEQKRRGIPLLLAQSEPAATH